MYIKLKLVIQGMLYRGKKKTQIEVHPISSDLKRDLNRPPNLTICKYGHDVYQTKATESNISKTVLTANLVII